MQLLSRITLLILIFTALFSPAMSQGVAQGNNVPDLSFNQTGVVISRIQERSEFREVVVTPAGKILVAGNSRDDFDDNQTFVQFNQDGSLDSTFGVNGIVIDSIGPFPITLRCKSMTLDAAGNIITANELGVAEEFVTMRYFPDGRRDSTFGIDGIVETDFISTTYDEATDVVVQSDGKIITAGFLGNLWTNWAGLVRLHPDGTVDSTYGHLGLVDTYLDMSYQHVEIVLQADGKLILGITSYDSDTDLLVARFHTDGSIDFTFGGTGSLLIDTGTADEFSGLDIDGQGNIWVSGITTGQFYERFTVAKVTPSGVLDTSFNNTGILSTEVGTLNSRVHDVKALNNGTVLLAGQTNIGGSPQFVIYAIDAQTGAGDMNFGTHGEMTAYWGMIEDECFAVEVQPSGEVLAVGRSWYDPIYWEAVVARFLAAPIVGLEDVHSSEMRLSLFPNPAREETSLSYQLEKTGRVSLFVTDLMGRKIKTFLANEHRVLGDHREILNLSGLPSGNYVVVLEYAGKHSHSRLFIP